MREPWNDTLLGSATSTGERRAPVAIDVRIGERSASAGRPHVVADVSAALGVAQLSPLLALAGASLVYHAGDSDLALTLGTALVIGATLVLGEARGRLVARVTRRRTLSGQPLALAERDAERDVDGMLLDAARAGRGGPPRRA